jgi:uncharacterized integral membrane protein (TIGR02327 family)
MLFISIFALSGVNFEKLIKKGKVIEARVLFMLISISLSYLVTNFIWDFLNFN